MLTGVIMQGTVQFFLRVCSSFLPKTLSIVSHYILSVLFVQASLLVGMQVSVWRVWLSISLPILYNILSSGSNNLIAMDRQQLELYTQDINHHGMNTQQILNHFMLYQRMCSDPLLVFRHMEEKAIATFMPEFWIEKALVYGEIGDYVNCFESLDLAQSRVEEDQDEVTEMIKKQEVHMRTKMVEEMRKFPITIKRSVAQFGMNLMNDQISLKREKQAEMVKLYESRYAMLKMETEKMTELRWNKMPQSWLFELYQKEDQMEQSIEERIHQNSVKIARDMRHHSMHTPIRKRDTQRLTKTMDSVEFMKKKRSSRDKYRNREKKWEEDEQPDRDMENDSNSMRIVSMPVGTKFSKLKRRVTFQGNTTVERISTTKAPLETPDIIEKMEAELPGPNSQSKGK